MHVAFIVHYFPPLNSTGARRVLAFAKYLHRAGHQVSILTTTKHSYDGFLTEKLPEHCTVVQLGKAPGLEAPAGGPTPPARGRSKLALRVLDARRALMKVTGQLIDSRLPFALRFWSRSLPSAAAEVLSGADVIVSSHPPWPVHLAGWFAARRFGKPWVADYRDQWSNNHMFPGSAFSAMLERSLERRLLSRAAALTVVSRPMEDYYHGYHGSVTTIENGYDAEAFEAARAVVRADTSDQRWTRLRYLGTITRDRIPRNLLAALRALEPSIRCALKVEFYGDCRLLAQVASTDYPDLADVLDLRKEVPHPEALRLMLSADALLFVENSSFDSLSAQGVLTTKIFEYLAAERPILADISPATLAGGVIARSGLGAAVSQDPQVLAATLTAIIQGGSPVLPDREYIRSFSREMQTRRLESLLERVVKGHELRP